ncbi:MAG: dihydrofolate reductase family protein, partial [Brevinema sp.]
QEGEFINLSSEKINEEAQNLRKSYEAIMIGYDYNSFENELLSTFSKNPPATIIIDPKLQISFSSKIIAQSFLNSKIIIATLISDKEIIQSFQKQNINIIVCKKQKNGLIDLNDLLNQLSTIKNILIEGIGWLATLALESKIVDKVKISINPKILHSSLVPIFANKQFIKIGSHFELRGYKIKTDQEDIVIEGYFK